MAFNIFRVDWILVDTIIIILLVLLLISVKIFKEAYRWRFSLSNEFLTRTTAKSLSFNLDRPSIYIKKWNLTKSKVIQEEISSKPSIFIIRTHRKQMLLKILTEGLSTYGFNVVNIWLKIKADKGKSKTIRDIERKIQQIIPSFLTIYNQDLHLLSQRYVVVNFDKKIIPYNFITKDSNSVKLILINPRLNLGNIKIMQTLETVSNPQFQLFIIFSERLNPFFKNRNSNKKILSNKTLKNSNKFKYHTIQKAKSTFKYYETVLLSIIIKNIDKISKLDKKE
ncbi:MAG: hypothetical protein CEE42_16285 [Promethearchaeota archaeon Loki_b31]|nr:MAG: hypothetical protein CEE42_16285 [Candidatus Lokiarchaeota archaeon Loki_b31]